MRYVRDVGLSTNNEEQKIRIEQDARVALLQHFGSYVRSWTTILVTIAIVFFTAVQVREALSALFWVVLFPLGSQLPYAMMRWAWHGRLCERTIDVDPPNDKGPYLRRLHDMVTLRAPDASASHGFRILSWTCDWLVWLVWFAHLIVYTPLPFLS
jgi:hypothetical protein